MGFAGERWQVYDPAGVRKYVTGTERLDFIAAAGQLRPRPRALCHTLAFTGARVSEVLALTRRQVEAELGVVRIQSLKRRRLLYRHVPVPGELIDQLLALVDRPGDVLIPMHRSHAWRTVREVMASCGISGPMATCKGLRHGFCMLGAIKGVPGPVLQRWMGHSDLATTSTYIDAVGLEERAFAERMWEATVR